MERLANVLEEVILRLKSSDDSIWSYLSVDEVISRLESEVEKIASNQPVDVEQLNFLFLPTGCIQEISIDNGWGDEFVELSKPLDEFVEAHRRK